MVVPFVAIILVNYINVDVTKQCLDSLMNITYNNYKVYIVDNASPKESIDKLKSLKEKYKFILIESNKNLGFAGGNNLAIEQAKLDNAEYFLLLNNDTLVESDFLTQLVTRATSDGNIGVTTGLIMYYPQKELVWYAGGDIDFKHNRTIHYGIKTKISNELLISKEVSFVSGCCMLISRKVIDDIGGLPEDYFMYYEDEDYCIQISQKGYKMIYEPKAKIYHCVSISSGGEMSPFSIEWSNRSRRLLEKKYKILFKGNRIIGEIKAFYQSLKGKNKIKKIMAYRRSFKKNEII